MKIKKTILFYLHGGPGIPTMAYAHIFQDQLEKHFTIVHWDQRGAGKSYNTQVFESMTLEQMISDTLELVSHLRKTFDQDKIFLLGHSWVSFLGINAIRKQPDWFHAYVGVGQVENLWEKDKKSCQFALKIAKERDNQEALKILSSLAPYPAKNKVDNLFIQREWIYKFGGSFVDLKKLEISFQEALKIPGYSLTDLVNLFPGLEKSLKNLWDQWLETDLGRQGYDFKVPIFFYWTP